MKAQKVNPNNMNPMQMNAMSSMMGMMNSIQKIGKGKRKYSVTLDKGTKKFLSKFIEEIKKQFAVNNGMQNVNQFLDYVKSIADTKDRMELKLSYEEQEFLTRMVTDAVKGMEAVKFKWYQLIKKSMTKLMIKQYRELLIQLKK
ncbi:hypothetical protein H5J22_07675 [Cetobacterium sp. 8H]|uniref:hypothetical protein n=1 Tax=Cetobacterium sp. 8H TaxID=2759681 RepID=UPI00163BBA6B|nr:hypothetical protein [Cetobacterium sp. 8H]MBC2851286.1 hypothetical protein [Cetobacterium sp. 8H]